MPRVSPLTPLALLLCLLAHAVAFARQDGAAAATPAPSPEAPPPAFPLSAPAAPRPGALVAAISPDLVRSAGRALLPVPPTELRGVRYVALYYSASWCAPCHQLAPVLARAYRQIKARRPEFELVLVSADRATADMKGFAEQHRLPFPMIRPEAVPRLTAVHRPPHERGIPNLVFLDADGRELSLSFTPEGEVRGPIAVLEDIVRKLGL
jgi:nucleoredoxin